MNKYALMFGLVLLLTGLFLSSGCTKNIPGIPFTTGQFIYRSTDLNYAKFVNGDYNGMFLIIDNNKLSVSSVDINAYDINWSQLINFPSGCADNQAVKIVGSSLVCIDLTTDTNYETNGLSLNDINNLWDRTGTTLEPIYLNDSLDIGTGELNGGQTEIKSSGTSTYPLQVKRSSNDSTLMSTYESASGDGAMYLTDGSGNFDVGINTNGTNYFKGGDFGVGTASPQARFHIWGTGGITGGTYGDGINKPDFHLSGSYTGTQILSINNYSGTRLLDLSGNGTLNYKGPLKSTTGTGPKLYLYSTSYGLALNSAEATIFSPAKIGFRNGSWNGTKRTTIDTSNGNIDTDGNITIESNHLCDDSTCYKISDLNYSIEPSSLYDTSMAGLILGYNFNNVDETSVFDSSENGYVGTLVGSPTRTDGIFSGYAYDFNGAGQYIQVSDYKKPTTNEYTLMAWVKPDGANASGTILGATYNYASGCDITWRGNGNYVQVRSAYNTWKYSNYVFTDSDNWVHVALTRDSSGNYAFYRNGVPAGSGTGLNFSNNNNFYVGKEQGGDYFEGGIDEPRMYDKVMSQEEIMAIVNRKQVLDDGSISTMYARYNTANNLSIDNDIESNTIKTIPLGKLVAGYNFNDDTLNNGKLFDSGMRNNHATTSNLTFGTDDFGRRYGIYGASTSVVIPTPSDVVGSGKTFVIVYKTPSSMYQPSTLFDISGKVKLQLYNYGQADLKINGSSVKNWGGAQYWGTNKWYMDIVILHADNTTSLYHVPTYQDSLGTALTSLACNNHTTPSGNTDVYIGSTSAGSQEIVGIQSFMAFDDELTIQEINRIMYKFYELPNPKIPLGNLIVTKDGNVGIGLTNPIYPLQVNGSNSNISIYADKNISATGFITRTSVYDKTQGLALEKIKDADEYKTRTGDINHQTFFGYTNWSIINYFKPETETYKELVCAIPQKEICKDINWCEWIDDLEKCYTQNVCGLENIKGAKEKCGLIEKTRIIYPHKILVEGVSLDQEINVLRQAIYELKEQTKILQNELCKKDISYSFCKQE